jgi:hypothetical protein
LSHAPRGEHSEVFISREQLADENFTPLYPASCYFAPIIQAPLEEKQPSEI